MGDCWFLSALSVLAEHRGGELVRDLFPGSQGPAAAVRPRLELEPVWRRCHESIESFAAWTKSQAFFLCVFCDCFIFEFGLFHFSLQFPLYSAHFSCRLQAPMLSGYATGVHGKTYWSMIYSPRLVNALSLNGQSRSWCFFRLLHENLAPILPLLNLGAYSVAA